jgi:hypothetical protein
MTLTPPKLSGRGRLGLLLVLAALAALVAAVIAHGDSPPGASPQARTAFITNQKLTKTDAVVTDSFTSICAEPEPDVTSMISKQVTIGGTDARRALVTFSTDLEWHNDPHVQGAPSVVWTLNVDGVEQNRVNYSSSAPDGTSEINLQGFTTITPPLDPGQHTIGLDWFVIGPNPREVCSFGPTTLVVQHT